jgi:hypothetical protein
MNQHHASDDILEAIPVSKLTPKAITWLWLKRLAIGKLAILDGDPNLGKSLITLDLAARLSTGRPFPDGTPSPGPANVLVINGEDGNQDTIQARLLAVGADMDRVFVVHRKTRDGCFLLRLPSEVAALERLIETTGAKLVIIDPIVAFLDPSVQIASDACVRRALQPLIDLADRYQCVILLIRHLNKTGGHTAIYRGGGSIGFVGVCRAAWLVTRAPRDPKQCILAEVKNNLSGPQTSLRYEVVAPEDEGEGEVARINWLGLCSLSANQLLAVGARLKMGTALMRACDFLKLFLKDGPRLTDEIWEASRECCFGKRTLDTAKAKLSIRSKKCYVNKRPVFYWLWPGQELPDHSTPHKSEEFSIDTYLDELRQRYPPGTPIDDL